jgi:hypothetical protein
MTNVEAYEIAGRKARYGHQAQLVWKNRDGSFGTAVRSSDAIRRALLAVGTKGRFTEISERNIKFAYGWRDGIRMLRNAKYGC